MKKHPVMTSQFPGKCTIVIRTPFIWSKFQSTRSRIAFLADKVTYNNRTQFGAGRVHLQSNLSEGRSHTVRRTLNPTTRTEWWHWKATGIQQQQQRLSGDVSSSGKLVAVENLEKEMSKATRRDDQTSSRKVVRNSVSFVDKRPQFEIDLRFEGVSQCTILQDEEQMKEINKKLEKLRIGSSRKSLRDDLKEKSDTIFSEESSRAIYDMGNVELIEMGQASATIQCLSFLKHVPDGLNMCPCGIWLRPSQNTMDRVRGTFAALRTPYFVQQ